MKRANKPNLLGVLSGKKIILLIVWVVSTLVIANTSCRRWPVGKSPAEVGRKAADYVLGNQRMGHGYADACTYYGMLTFAEATVDTKLRDRVITEYEPYLSGEKKPETGHGDKNCFGIVPFEIYRQTGKREYLPLGKYLSDEEWENPRKDGLTRYTRWWVDDMYVVACLQIQAYKNLGDIKYADRAVNQQLAHIDKLLQPNGLFYHTHESHFFWARGNGWAAAGMTEVLLGLPESYSKRAQLLQAYQKQMKGLIECQDSSGMWHQILDDPNAWLETSSTSMFVFALATGVKQGWLPEKPYKDAAERAWLVLVTEYMDEKGRVKEIGRGTWGGPKTTKEDYLNVIRWVGNLHGQCAILWAATAVERMGK